MICGSIEDTVSESFRVADCRDGIGSVQGCEVYAEVERLRKLCASRPKWPDLTGMSFQEVDDAAEAFYAETEKWELSINAAGRGEE